jgi:alpha-tubulin suppressor-like RCC1 family protein
MCATSREGTLRCVDPAHPTPRAIATTAHAGQVAVGSGHACARLEGDRFVCWGSNGSGQVGDGSLAGRLPVLVDGPVKVTQLVAHGNATCARGASGRLWCWGLTHAKHVASTGFSPGPFLVPVANVGRLAMGSHVDCAVLGDGALMCWGDNQWGQIPGVAKEVWVPPTRVPMASGALDATIGSTHACMLDRSGGVTCWGENRVGEVGVGRTSAFEGPTLVRPLPHVAWLHAIGAFTLARSSTGPVHFWGGRNGNPHDAMADADITPTPKEAPLLAGAAELSSFFDHRGCLRSAKGDVSCWEGGDFEHPAPFPAIQDVSDIAVGREHACAVRTDKSLWCWGHNGSGQLGDGTTTDRAAPVRARLDGVLEVVAGERHTCALREDGHVACWGRGSVGQRGDGVTQVRATPAEVLMDKEL